ncbi:uncharacterized protein Z519_12752 [Cladophialophora bantiana CBS 173.52]|uniref:REJ domain-containing protein n=1 Tax=Cladophialophora bantiana (strain ATCC 10958 / CBS 173.52 / CDC B-1940 / NIH 8579) TaxID=1442370 RepID=A0A0D2FIV4_CLAB1|nr:uncharacterized protein Z519_12752 [Cladophialophora bantiana CBS 173.52]KIW86627.1 hypothetical protein Z519_12752 [Cladophialophora bantiana CBS 173.52]
MSAPNASIPGIRSEDSWVEISSRASSASLSSTNNDIITTGLQVRSQDERQSRQLQPSPHVAHPQPRSVSTAGSSQDEYEESESESDRVLSSSNEEIYQGDTADDDETSTALGVGSLGKVFTPQPNAFSHPPSSHNRSVQDPYFPPGATLASEPQADRSLTQRGYQQQMHPRNRPASSSYQPDHDAALRASLTTLLSCAAAVRPKNPDARPPPQRASTQPTTLRLVPESALEDGPRQRRTSSPNKQTKRKSRESSKDRHAAKKVRAAGAKAATAVATGEELISPTLASWMISACVVLVFSAISFSAGYAWGREVGRIEGEMGLPGGSCGQESIRSTGTGLRRLRWSSAASSIRA